VDKRLAVGRDQWTPIESGGCRVHDGEYADVDDEEEGKEEE